MQISYLSMASVFVSVFSFLVSPGCGGFRPYKAMVDAAQSEESPMSLARDDRLKLELRRSIVEHELLKGLTISPYVCQDRAYLVGVVHSREQRQAVVALADGLGVFRSVQWYLPVLSKQEDSSFTDDATITAELKAKLVADPSIVASRVDLKTIDGTVVLVGVVGLREKEEVLHVVESDNKVKGVIDFLSLPDPGYERLRPGLR